MEIKDKSWTGQDQIQLVPSFSKVRVDTTRGYHRVVVPMVDRNDIWLATGYLWNSWRNRTKGNQLTQVRLVTGCKVEV